MKNDEAISLQKELVFYSSLIAEHERINGKQSFNSNCTIPDNKNASSYTKQAKKLPLSKKFTTCKLNNLLQQDSQRSSSFISSHSFNKQLTLDYTLNKPSSLSKKINSKFPLNCSSNKKLQNYSVKNQFSKSNSNLKSSAEYIWHNSHMCHGRNSKYSGNQLSDEKSAKKQITTKSYPEKLIGEIMSVTEQLKMKSESLSILKNKQNSPNAKNTTSEKRKFMLPCMKKNAMIASLSPKVESKKDVKQPKTYEMVKVISHSKCNEKGTQYQTTYSNMLEDLKAIEKKLSQAKEPVKSKIGKYRYKTSPLPRPFISRNNKNSPSVRKQKGSNRYLFNKYSSKPSTLRKTPTSSNRISASHNFSSPSNCTLSSSSNIPDKLPKNANQLSSTYKIINNVRTPSSKTNLLHKVVLAKNIKRCKQFNCTKKRSAFKLVNELNMSKSNTYDKKVSTSVKSSQESPLSAKFVSLYNKAAASTPLNSDVDLDLLMELASENFHQKRIYRSKSTIINSHSVETRAAKMIKSKYLTKKFSARKNHLFSSKYFRGNFRNSPNRLHHYNKNMLGKTKSMSRDYFSNKLRSQNLGRDQKNIISLGGEKFMVGSSGRTLKKLPKSNPYYFRRASTKGTSPRFPNLKMPSLKKNSPPVSKTLASRALNRSIDTVLSASMKKKLRKVNIYCMFYNRFGRCNKGLKCSYVHDPSKIAVCKRFLRGTCKNEKCLFLHEINPGKMAVCSFFLRGSCTKSDCPYRHKQLSPDAILCKDFIQGYCRIGKECLKAHVLLCQKHIQGICKKGNKCSFIHNLTQEKNTSLNSEVILKKSEDQSLDAINRYFECNAEGTPVTKGKSLVIPRVKCLPEQPSFISLKMNEIL